MVSNRATYCIANTIIKYWNGIAPEYVHEIFNPLLCRYSLRSQMTLDMPLRKKNRGQKSLSFLGPKTRSRIDPRFKNVATSSSFILALKKKCFTSSAKLIQITTTFLWSILSFDSFIATSLFVVSVAILLSSLSNFILVFPLIFTYTSRGTLMEVTTFTRFF